MAELKAMLVQYVAKYYYDVVQLLNRCEKQKTVNQDLNDKLERYKHFTMMQLHIW